MKTILHVARNHNLSLIDQPDGKQPFLVASTEVVLTVTEPKYAVIEDGKIAKYPDTETVRFHSRAKSLRALAEQFNEWADELDNTFGDLETTDDGDIDQKNGGEKPADS